MDQIFYCPAARGFLVAGIHPIAAGAVEISAERHRELLDAQSHGLVIVPGDDGVPIAVEPVVTDEHLAAAARAERDARLLACDWTQLADVPAETRAAWASYRQALRDVTAQPGFPRAVSWPNPPQGA